MGEEEIMLEEICYHLIPNDDDWQIVCFLLKDAGMNARICDDDEQLCLAYIKVLEEYVYASKCNELRQLMLTYWKEIENERERNTTPH
jgi:hypothetical protein